MRFRAAFPLRVGPRDAESSAGRNGEISRQMKIERVRPGPRSTGNSTPLGGWLIRFASSARGTRLSPRAKRNSGWLPQSVLSSIWFRLPLARILLADVSSLSHPLPNRRSNSRVCSIVFSPPPPREDRYISSSCYATLWFAFNDLQNMHSSSIFIQLWNSKHLEQLSRFTLVESVVGSQIIPSGSNSFLRDLNPSIRI